MTERSNDKKEMKGEVGWQYTMDTTYAQVLHRLKQALMAESDADKEVDISALPVKRKTKVSHTDLETVVRFVKKTDQT